MLTATQICRFLFHISAVLIYGYGYYYDTLYVQTKLHLYLGFEHSDFAGRAKYLTIWNLVLQLGFFLALSIQDVGRMIKGEVKGRRGPYAKTVDYVFAALAFPLAAMVFGMFWVLWAIDRELVFPKSLDSFFPMWLNHIMHTLILPFIFVEMFTARHAYPSRREGLTGITIASTLYIIWTFIVAYVSGVWTYPVMQVLGWRGRGLFFIVSIFAAMVIYLCGEFCNNRIWGKSYKKKFEAKKRNKAD